MQTLIIALLALHPLTGSATDTAAVQSERGGYLFSSFRGNGEDGLHLAYSRDGYTWTALRNDGSFLAPEVGGKLMRDPCIRRGPDGVFHLVWTTGWGDRGFGYSHSADLIHWAPQRFIPVTETVQGAVNTWAPELYYDREQGRWLIIWATTIEGRYPEQEKDDGGLNHRQYFTSTKDFVEFSETALFFDPGFNCIDGTLIEEGGLFRLIFKDERLGKKALRMASSPNPGGPYGAPGDLFTGEWTEGPSAIRVGEEWFVYFDHYAKPQFHGGAKSRDLKSWEDISDKLTFPKDFRHGTVFAVDPGILDALLPLK